MEDIKKFIRFYIIFQLNRLMGKIRKKNNKKIYLLNI